MSLAPHWLSRDGYSFTSESCQVAKELADSFDLRVTLVLRITLFLVGSLLFAAFLYANNSLTLYHANARLLFKFNYLWVFMQSLTYIALHIYDLVRFSQEHSDPCDYLIPAWLSVLMRALPNIATYGQCWSMFALALERSVATYASVPYEQNSSITMGWFMVAAQVVMPLIWIYVLVADYNWNELKITCTVSSTKTNGLFQVLTAVLAAVEVFTIVLLCTLFIINKYLQYESNRTLNAPNKLGHKFQLMENIRAIRLLFPINIVHFLCFAGTMIAQPLNNKLSFNLSPRDYSIRIETLNFLPIYCVLMPVVLWYVCRKYSEYRRGPNPKACSISDCPQVRQKETEIYFRQFDKAINQPNKRDSFIGQCSIS
ncbi:hypothetical protein QR680_008686 [Steinernema hermaphroditum]|uniref:G-protein coupled receptors family 1 profile domain-containing protein n=1 Tax=Steinernema hermaphroditum TaxID=289476 RepID=A0AA39IHK6_9BILA|nr:hypothetical protein QR680_008686 [Steinernema hermaphroditum]